MREIKFGICQVCGSKGTEYPAADLTTADSQSNIDGAASSLVDTPKGVQLEYYKGKLMCRVCKNRLSADDVSLREADKHARSQSFRDRAGFKRSV